MNSSLNQIPSTLLSLLLGAILGYAFFLFVGYFPGVWEFFIPDHWRDIATAGFSRIAGAAAFVFFSWLFSKGDKGKVSKWALWISITYFLLVETFFLWAFQYGIVSTIWFPLTMTICGIAGSLIGYVIIVIIGSNQRTTNQSG